MISKTEKLLIISQDPAEKVIWSVLKDVLPENWSNET